MAKYNVIFFDNNFKNEVTAETLDEALSICVALFNQGSELWEIQEDGACLLLHSEIYDKIERAIY
jgi:hypothetical protein